ncbi:transcription antitermination factor NusB [Galenea microaerophila]
MNKDTLENIQQAQPGMGEEVKEKPIKLSPRTAARQAALQALYQWLMNVDDPYEIIKQFQLENRLEGVDVALFNELVTQVTRQSDALDALYEPYLDRSVTLINPVEKSILRLGVYELKNKPEIPYRVVLNESVELAKRFGAEESHKYINGVLDKVAKSLRSLEFQNT